MRLRKIKNAREKLKSFPNLVLDNPNYYKDNWSTLFGNNNDIYLEIGMGKGKFISTNAQLNKEINYIGIEVEDSIVLRAARKYNDLNLSNLKFMNYDAIRLAEIFPSNSIKKIFLNFSDPWPKTRHAKRRLTSDDFLKVYRDILTDAGVIEMKTDNQNLFEYSLINFNKFKFDFLDINLNLHQEFNEEIITTEYEEKFIGLKKIIYYLKVKK